MKSPYFHAHATLQQALSMAGIALQVDKTSLLRLAPASSKLISLAQWARKSEFLDHTNLEGFVIDLEKFPYWKTFFINPKPLVLHALHDLDPAYHNEKKELEAKQVLSQMAIPVFRRGKPMGCICIVAIEKQRTWQAAEIEFLEQLSDLFSDFLERTETEAEMAINSPLPAEKDPGQDKAHSFYLSQSQLISKAGLDLMHMQTKDQVLEFSARFIHTIFPGSVVSVSEHIQGESILITRYLRGIDPRMRKLMDLLGIKAEGKAYSYSPEREPFRIMSNLVLHRIKGGLHEVTLGAITKTKARILESLCGIKKVYAAGFMANGKLYGSLVLIHKEKMPVMEGLMESFIRMVSMSLNRIDTQQELIYGRSYLQNILSAMEEGVVEIDLKGNIRFVNQSVLESTGYKNTDVVGKHVSLFLTNDNSMQVLLDNTLGSMPTERRSFELDIKTTDGTSLQLMVNSSMIKDQWGNPDGFLGVLSDIGRLRDKERAIRELEINQQLLEFKQQFMSNMSHEMLTPFNGILGVADMIKNTTTDPQNIELLGIISDSTQQLLRVIKSLWEAHGLKEGALGLQENEFSLCDFMLHNLKLFAAAAREKEAGLWMYCQQSLNYRIIADELRINQVLTNLIGNAIKFLHQGGRVDVRCNLTVNPDNTALLRLEVEDNGPGIPKEKHSRIFSLLEQVDNSHTRQHDGLGLGLHLCSELVELMNGRKGFESKPGEGSRFWFEVPVKIPGTSPSPCLKKCRNELYENAGISKLSNQDI
ncbi:MAG: ATP-binding protein [Bacteroidota bacterium]